MYFRKRAKEVAVARGAVRYPRVAQHSREHGPETAADKQQGHKRRGPWPVNAPHELRWKRHAPVCRLLAPGNRSEKREMDSHVEHNGGYRADEDGARYRLARLPNLVSHVAHVVVAEICIDREYHSGADFQTEPARRRGRAECNRRIEPDSALDQNPRDYSQHARPDRDGDPTQARDVAIEQPDYRDPYQQSDETRWADRNGDAL